MTSSGRVSACPNCGENARRTYTELGLNCRNEHQVVEWSECGRCRQWLAFRIEERENRSS